MSEVWAAADRVQGGGIRATALLPSPWLAQRCRAARMLLKLENQQATGSFKARSAVNKARKLLADLHADVPGALTACMQLTTIHSESCCALGIIKRGSGDPCRMVNALECPALLHSFSQVSSLTDEERERGLVACSSGNFAAALLHACAALQQKTRRASGNLVHSKGLSLDLRKHVAASSVKGKTGVGWEIRVVPLQLLQGVRDQCCTFITGSRCGPRSTWAPARRRQRWRRWGNRGQRW